MSDESTLRKKAREAITAGKLPSCLPQRMWGGPGVGACCAICGKPAGQDEVEFELEFSRDGDDGGDRGSPHHVHAQCFAAWEFERTNFEVARGTASSGNGAQSAARPASAGGDAKVTAASSRTTLPAPSNDRMIAGHGSDGTKERGSA